METTHQEMPKVLNDNGTIYQLESQIWGDWDGPSSWAIYRADDELLAISKNHDDSGTYVLAMFDVDVYQCVPVEADCLIKAMFELTNENGRAIVNGKEIDFEFEYEI